MHISDDTWYIFLQMLQLWRTALSEINAIEVVRCVNPRVRQSCRIQRRKPLGTSRQLGDPEMNPVNIRYFIFEALFSVEGFKPLRVTGSIPP